MADIQITVPGDSQDTTHRMTGIRSVIEPDVSSYIETQRTAGRRIVPTTVEGDTNEETAAMLRVLADAINPPAEDGDGESGDGGGEV